MRTFRQLTSRHQDLCRSVADFYHDIFLLGLASYQSAFVKTKLDDFFSHGQDDISNLDLRELQEQPAARASKVPSHSTRSDLPIRSKGTANVVSATDSSSKKVGSSSRCPVCHGRHKEDTCWTIHPELATEEWRTANRFKIQVYRDRRLMAPLRLHLKFHLHNLTLVMRLRLLQSKMLHYPDGSSIRVPPIICPAICLLLLLCHQSVMIMVLCLLLVDPLVLHTSVLSSWMLMLDRLLVLLLLFDIFLVYKQILYHLRCWRIKVS